MKMQISFCSFSSYCIGFEYTNHFWKLESTNLSIWADIQIRVRHAYHGSSNNCALSYWRCVHSLSTYGTVVIDVTDCDVNGGQCVATPRIRSGDGKGVNVLRFTIQKSIGWNNSSALMDGQGNTVCSCVEIKDLNIAHCNAETWEDWERVCLFPVCFKNLDIEMKDQLNLRVLTIKNRSI